MNILDQGIFLFDNQYHPDIISRVYHQIRETTWDHCMNIQAAMCQHKVIGGVLADFKIDEELNKRQGFPKGAYTLFIKENLLPGNQKYILEHFIRNHEMFSLRDMLKNPMFKKQYIFHIADYVFMDLKCQLAQNGTYLIIPIDTPDGISAKQMNAMMNDYGNPYTPSRWLLEMRPRVSYGYCEANCVTLFEDTDRIYLSKFTDKQMFYKADGINDWKVCITDTRDEFNLMRATCGVLMFDEVTGEPYLEVSTTFRHHIERASFVVHVFAYNEAHKAGFTLSPNYIGPSQFLKTTFDEYMATVEAQKLKVVAMDADGGWTKLDGADKQFDKTAGLVTVGFTPEECWISVPTKEGVAPIYHGNFRVWEYDNESDTLGRMVATDMQAAFPNIYFYKMKSDAHMLYIEWYRDDVTVGTAYDDFTKDYRNFVGDKFAISMVDGTLPKSIVDFKPVHSEFSANDFVKNVLLYSSHEYRIEKMKEILSDTGLHWDEIVNAIDAENVMYTTVIYDVAKSATIQDRFEKEPGNYSYVRVSATEDTVRPYSLFVDGQYVTDTQTYWKDFAQYITIPKKLVQPDSVIIIDLYEKIPQLAEHALVTQNFMRSLVVPPMTEAEFQEQRKDPNKKKFAVDPSRYLKDIDDALFKTDSNQGLKTAVTHIHTGWERLSKVSANDIVVANRDGSRIDPSRIIYGLYANEFLVQIPEAFVDWDALGITIDDPRIADRVAVRHPQGDFRSIVFRLILPTESEFAKMSTNAGDHLKTSDGKQLMVNSGEVFVTTEGYEEIDPTKINKFSKKVKVKDLALRVLDIGEGELPVTIFNNTVYRRSTSNDLSDKKFVTIPSFCGADDPTRLVAFINGTLAPSEAIDGQIPEFVNDDFRISFNGMYDKGDIGEVVYLPFPTDRFDVMSGEDSVIHLENTGVMTIGIHDMIFENGLRIPNDDLIRVTNQIIKAPNPNTMYTIIRTHRDSNLFEFHDVEQQSIMDKLFAEDPAYKQHCIDNSEIYQLSEDEASILAMLD